jgi:hypothetical protein
MYTKKLGMAQLRYAPIDSGPDMETGLENRR